MEYVTLNNGIKMPMALLSAKERLLMLREKLPPGWMSWDIKFGGNCK